MDWGKIRKDYIAGKGTYRELAKKYGAPMRTLAAKAKAEDWVGLREQACNRAATNTVDRVATANGKVDTSLQAAAAALAAKALEGIQNTNPEEARALKAYSGVLRDLKEVLNIRPELDIKEQEARIEKLRRENARDEEAWKAQEIAIIYGGAAEWAE